MFDVSGKDTFFDEHDALAFTKDDETAIFLDPFWLTLPLLNLRLLGCHVDDDNPILPWLIIKACMQCRYLYQNIPNFQWKPV